MFCRAKGFLVVEALEGLGQMFDDVAGDEAFFSHFSCSKVAGEAMQVHADETCLMALVASGKQSADDTREHVAAASRCHAGVACRVEKDVSVGNAECRVMAFKDDVAVDALGQLASFRQLFVASVAGIASQSV